MILMSKRKIWAHLFMSTVHKFCHFAKFLEEIKIICHPNAKRLFPIGKKPQKRFGQNSPVKFNHLRANNESNHRNKCSFERLQSPSPSILCIYKGRERERMTGLSELSYCISSLCRTYVRRGKMIRLGIVLSVSAKKLTHPFLTSKQLFPGFLKHFFLCYFLTFKT